jgi:peptidoglycan-N-acetylglucosamine deacetylase
MSAPRNGANGNASGKKCLMTTSWDDGHPLDFRVAELLTKYGLTGTFYVPRASQKQVMTAARVRELSCGFEIGAHTLDHVRIDRMPDAEASRQLLGSRRWVEETTGKKCSVFCFPGGKFNGRQLRLVRETGYRAARTVELLSIAEPRSVGGLWIIPTTIHAYPHGPLAYAKNAAKRLTASHLLKLPAALFAKDWVALAKEMLIRTTEHGGVFHLWGHSWEIEQERQWNQLEAFLAFAGGRVKNSSCVVNGELCGGLAAEGVPWVPRINRRERAL